ncbi:MAG: SDR family NAD(P)-dependent oxidoreductase [Nitrospiraceae bacterium]
MLGVLATLQALLLLVRKSGGRIINMSSSLAGLRRRFSAACSRLQFALEAMTDAWCFELAPWGIRVTLIEPERFNRIFGRDRRCQRRGPWRGCRRRQVGIV